VLWNSPPIANYAVHYPLQDVELSGSELGAGDPLLISFAAANTDPNLSVGRQTLSKRAHLAWGAGPHACPAKDPALLISVQAIEKLLNTLPDIELGVPDESLTWRPGRGRPVPIPRLGKAPEMHRSRRLREEGRARVVGGADS
jgi:cytochrome P450